MIPAVIADEDDSCRGRRVEMLPTPLASSPPRSAAPGSDYRFRE